MAIARPLGQHWTVGHALAPPVVPVATPAGIFGLPVAICCLGLILFVIASTIVLALIPLYLKRRDLNGKCTSDPISSTFNVDQGILPSGQLSPNNRAALQSGLNGYLAGQNGFAHCSLAISDANVGNCPSTGRLLQKIRKRQPSFLARTVRQTNTNCVSQQLTTTSELNCGCRCVSGCLRRRVNQLNSLLLNIIVPITFPDGSISATINGIDVHLNPTTTSTSTMTPPITTMNVVDG